MGRAGAAGLALALGLGTSEPARAFDLFGLFGAEEAPPAPSPAALPYSVRFQGVEDEDLLQALKDTSGLYRLRNDAPPDGEGLLHRAEADAPRIVAALSGFGYYAGTATFRIEDVVLGGDAAALRAVRAAEAARNRSLVAVRIAVDQGPLYHLRRITVLDPSGVPFGPEAVPERLTRIDGEVPARSATVLAREAALVDRFAARGTPSPRWCGASRWSTTPPTSWTSPS